MNKPNSSLSQFIEEYPLYAKFGTDQPVVAADLDNLAFNFFCKPEKAIQPFRLEAAAHHINGAGKPPITEGTVEFTEMFFGICQSCLSYKINIIVSGASQKEKPKYFVRKIGQYPAPEETAVKLPDEISYFLNEESLDLYRKALKNLELEQGTGAFAYLRKMIAYEVERIIEAISDPYSPGGNKVAEAFSNYKELKHKIKFIEEITPHLPKSLREHGASSLLVLQDTTSVDMDEMTEQECIKKSKDIDTLFRHLLKKIYGERNDVLSQKAPGKYFLRHS